MLCIVGLIMSTKYLHMMNSTILLWPEWNLVDDGIWNWNAALLWLEWNWNLVHGLWNWNAAIKWEKWSCAAVRRCWRQRKADLTFVGLFSDIQLTHDTCLHMFRQWPKVHSNHGEMWLSDWSIQLCTLTWSTQQYCSAWLKFGPFSILQVVYDISGFDKKKGGLMN